MTENHPASLTILRRRYPGWKITATWVTAATGPDHRILHAQRGSVVLTAYDAASLAEQIEQAEQH